MIDADQFAFEEAFNIIAGELLGEGACRKVFACKIDTSLVVKVEKDPQGMFQNAHEFRMWQECQTYRKVADWLAPCVSISTHGMVLIQKRVEPVPAGQLPKQLPTFLIRDRKPSHFGMFEGRIVCCDYALSASTLPVKLKTVDW